MSEWQTDKDGRHFRQVGPDAIEYAPTIRVGGVEIENIGDNLERLNESLKQSRKALEEKIQQKKRQEETDKLCPFRPAPSLCSDCKKDCALYRATGCAMKRREAVQDTNGKPCPFMRVCTTKCAVYDHGCTL